MIENKLINTYHFNNHHNHLLHSTTISQQQQCVQYNDCLISTQNSNNDNLTNQLVIQNSTTNMLARNSPSSFNSLTPPPPPPPPQSSVSQNPVSSPQLYNLSQQQTIAMISTTSPPTPPLSVTSSQVACKLNNSKLNNTTNNNHNQQNEILLECNGCHSYIQERYYLLVMDRAWHIDCLRCTSCKSSLDTQMSCFIKDGLIYCKDDYFKVFPRKCHGCCIDISPDQMIMKAKQFIFHTKCFKCVSCDKHLNTGDEYGIKESSILCRTHFYNDVDSSHDLNNNNTNEIVQNIKFEPYANFDFKQQHQSAYYSQLYSPIGTDALPTPSSSSSTSSSSSYFNLGPQQHSQHFENVNTTNTTNGNNNNNNNQNYYLCNMPPTPGYSPPNSLIHNNTTAPPNIATSLNETKTISNKTQNLSSPASTTVINQKGRPKKRKLTNLNDNNNVNINDNNSNNEDLVHSLNKQAKTTTVTPSSINTNNITEQLSPKHKKHASKMQHNDSNADLLDEDDLNNSNQDDDDNSKFMPNSPDYFSEENCYGNDLQGNGNINAGGYFDTASAVAAAAAAAAAAQRQKRMRTSFKHHQLRVMKTYFELNHNPDAKDLKQLSQKTGLSKRVLQVWFQNARAKYRRNQSSSEPNTSNANNSSMHQGSQQQNSNNSMSENLTTVNSLSSLSTSSNSSANSGTSQNLLIQQLNGYSPSTDMSMTLGSLHSHHHAHLHQMQHQPHHAHHNMFSNDTLNELDLMQAGQHSNGHLIKLDNEINDDYHHETQSQQHIHSMQQVLSLQANDDLLIN